MVKRPPAAAQQRRLEWLVGCAGERLTGSGGMEVQKNRSMSSARGCASIGMGSERCDGGVGGLAMGGRWESRGDGRKVRTEPAGGGRAIGRNGR